MNNARFKIPPAPALLGVLLSLLLAGQVQADTINGTGWKGTSGTNWSTAGNWDSTAPSTGGSGERSLFFGNAWVTAGRTGQGTAFNDLSVVTTGWNGYRLTFENITTPTNFTIAGNSFTLFDFGSGNFPRIENDSTTNQTFALTNGATIAFNDSQTTHEGQVNPVNGNLTFSSGTKIDLAGTTQLQIWGSNGKTVTFGGVISSSGNSGANSAAINQNSTVVFGATNTYTGDTFINAGTLVLATNSATVANSTTFIRLGDTSATGAAANLNLNGGNSVFTPVNVRAGSSGTKTIANTAGTTGAANYGTNLFLDDNVTLFANSGGGNILAGSTLDLKSHTLTVDGTGSNYITGMLTNSTGSGTLTKNGTGTLTLGAAGTNTYSGATTINTGELIGVTGGSCSNSAVTVASGATNGVLLATSAGRWASGALTYNSGTTYADFNFGGFSPSTTTAPISVNGTLAINGTLNVIVRNLPAVLTNGVYPLIKYSGSFSGTAPTTVFSAPSTIGAAISNDVTGKSLDLVITNGNVVSWAVGNGTWDMNTSANWKDPSGVAEKYLDGAFVTLNDTASGATPIAITLNTTVSPGSIGVTNSTKAYTISGTGGIAGSSVLNKYGTAALTLGTANTYTGGTALNAGSVTLDFTASGAPANNIVSASSALTLGGSALTINGNASANDAQTVASTSLNGANSITINAPSSRTETLTLGAVAQSAVGTTLAVLPTGAGTVTVAGSAGSNVSAPAATPINSATANYVSGCFVTYGTTDYAMVSGANIVALGSANYTANAGPNVDVGSAGYTTPSSTTSVNCMRFNASGAATVINRTVYTTGGILVTGGVGANNQTITSSGSTHSLEPNRSNTSGSEAVIWQNNTSGYLVFAGANTLDNGKTGNASWVQAGLGTVQYNQNASTANGFGGSMYLNGGYTLVSANGNAVFGPVATAATLNLNGGTVVAGASFTLDNGGLNARPIALGNAGGGLAAAAGLTLTVDGVVSGTGPLTIGTGTIPGSGGGTANTTAVVGSGTVIFNSGGNTYTGVTTITGGATLNINSEWALGGANYGGLTFNNGILQYAATLLNSTTDISTQPVSLLGNATIDVNGNSISLANPIGNSGGGALTVVSTAANGVLTLQGANTYTGGTTISSGTLNVNNSTGSGTGSGNVTVASGATLGGSGTISGSVTLNGTLDPGNGATVGKLTVGSLTLNGSAVCSTEFNSTPTNDLVVVTSSGGLVLNGGSFNLYTAGGTTPWTTLGTYNLIQYSGALSGTSTSGGSLDSTWTTDSASNAHVANPQTGYTYHFGTSGGYLTVTITLGATVGTWNVNSDGNWSVAGNWTGVGVLPPSSPGDSATLGVGTALRTVTLDANEAVGALMMTNTNSFVVASTGNTLTLDNKGAGATISVTAGTANAIQTAVALNDNTTATVSSGKSLKVSGVVSNAPSVTKTLTVNGAGTTILSAANSYGPSAGTTGTTLSGGGILQVANNSALGTGDLAVTGNATLQAGPGGSLPGAVALGNNVVISPAVTATFDDNNQGFVLGGVVSGSGTLAVIDFSALSFSGNNTYSGGTVINNLTTVFVSSDGATGGSAGQLGVVPASAGPTNVVINSGHLYGEATFTLHANRGIGIGPATGSTGSTGYIDSTGGQTFTVNGIIASAGNTGADNLVINLVNGFAHGTVALGGANTFNGTTEVDDGTLQLANASALQSSTLNYNNQGGTLSFGSLTAATFGGLSGAENLALLNGLSAAVALTVGGNNANTTYSGQLSGTGASLTKAGTGTLTLTGNNTYTTTTTVNGGVLQLSSGGVINGTSGSVSGVSGAQLVVNGGSFTASASCNLAAPSAGLLVSAGSATFDGGLTANAGNSSQASTDAPILATGGSLTASSLAMGRTSDSDTSQPASGSTTKGLYVNGGTVSITGNVALGNTSGANSTTTARVDSGSLTVGGSLIFGLNNGGRWSVVDVSGGTLTVNDTATGISVGSSQTGNAVLLVRGGTATAGKIGLGFGTVTNTAVVNMTNGSLYVGSGGIVQVSPNVIPTITLNGGILGATANWSSSMNMTLGGSTIQAADSTGSTHNISLSGVVSGAGALTKTGGGTLTLGGANTYTGNTLINGGDVNAGAAEIAGTSGPLGKQAANAAGTILFGGGTLQYSGANNNDYSGRFSTAGGQGISIDTGGQAVTFATALAGTGTSLTNTGGGTLTLSAANTYDGTTTVIYGGTLAVNGSLAGGAVTALFSGTLGGTGTIGGAVTVQSSGKLAPGGASPGTLTINNTLALSGTTALRLNRTSGVLTNDAVAGVTTLTKGGTLTITVNPGSDTLQGGDTFTLFSATTPGGTFSATNLPSLGSGTNLWTTNNYESVTVNALIPTNAAYARAMGVSLKIPITNLLANVGSLPAGGDTFTLLSVGASTNGASITTNANYVLFSSTNNLAETFTYTVGDARGGSATGSITVSTTNAVGSSLAFALTGNTATINIQGLPNYQYVVQTATNIAGPWVPIGTNTTDSTGSLIFVDTNATNSQQYYRTSQ